MRRFCIVLGILVGCKGSSTTPAPAPTPSASASPAATPPVPAVAVEATPLPPYEPYPEAFIPEAKRLEKLALAGDGNAAIELADWIQSAENIPPDLRRAAQLLEHACKAKDANPKDKDAHDACGRLALLHLAGIGVGVKNAALAVKMLDAACDAGSAWSCARVGAERLYATHIPYDYDTAMRQLQRSCDGGSIWGCEAIMRAMDRELVPKDAARMEKLLDQQLANAKKNCAAASSDAGLRRYDCFEWERVGVFSPGRDPQLRRDLPGSVEILCAAGNWRSCFNSKDTKLFDSRDIACKRNGDSRACGVLFDADLPRCKIGDCKACFEEEARAGSSDSPPDPTKLPDNPVYATACNLGCSNACETWISRARTPKERNERRTKVCDGGFYGRACVDAAEAASGSNKVVSIYESGCPAFTRYVEKDDLSARACLRAADAHRNGEGQSRDMRRAKMFYERACFLADAYATGRAPIACRMLGELEESEPSPDLDHALSYYISACEGTGSVGVEDWESCFRARELTRRGVPSNQKHRTELQTKLTKLLFTERRDGKEVDGGFQ